MYPVAVKRFLRRWLRLGLVMEIVLVGLWTFKGVPTTDLILWSAVCWGATAIFAGVDVLMNEDDRP
jgi:hypothetical protein